MVNQIFRIYTSNYKTFVITNDELWLSNKKYKNLEKFERESKLTGIKRTTHSYSLASFINISFNEASDSVTIKYKNKRNEDKKMDVEFGSKKLSNQFGHFLGQKLKMTKSQTKENKWKRSLIKTFWLIITFGTTYYLASLNDTDKLITSGSGKSKAVAILCKIIIDKIGHIGVIVIGTMISLLIIYQMYKRYKNPSNEIVYQQKLY